MEFMAQGKHISTSPVNQDSNYKRVLPTNLEWAGMWWIRSPDLADLKAKSLPLCVFSPFAAIFLCFSVVIEVNLVVVSFKCHFLPPQFRKSFETLVVLLLLWFSLFGHRKQPETVVKWGQLFENACSAQLQFMNKSKSCKFNYGALSGKSILRSDFLMENVFLGENDSCIIQCHQICILSDNIAFIKTRSICLFVLYYAVKSS